MAWGSTPTANAVGQSADTTNVTTSSVDTTGANTLFAVVNYYVGITATAPTVTDSKSNTWTKLTSWSDGVNDRIALYYAKNATVGSGHTVTVVGTAQYPGVCFLAFSGGDTTAPFDVENGGTVLSTSGGPGASGAPATANSLTISFRGSQNSDGGSYTVGSSFTISDSVDRATNGLGVGAAYKITSASENPTWTWANSQQEVLGIAVFKPAAGGGTTINTTVGNAVADGITAAVTRTIATSVGNAVANGVIAGVTSIISTTVGNAVAQGITATITTSGNTTISATPGNAVADGVTTSITRTVASAPGNAVANGISAGVNRVIAGIVGNAIANGVTATITGTVTISCSPGNALADGVSCAVTSGTIRSGGGGRVRKLANFSQYQVESESEKLARRIKQGIIKPTPQTIEPVRLAERKAAIQQAIEIDTQLRQLRAEAAAHQAEMQRMEALNQERKSRLIEQAMLRKQQELQMAQLQEQAAQEQAEMLDVAYVAKAVMDMLAARNRQ
jgi:hypothetical protein